MNTKEILKIERLKAGKTQQQIADYLNIERGSYAKYETGANTPTTENLIKLADLYHCSLDYLVGRYSLKEIARENFKQGYEKGYNFPDEILERNTPKKKKATT